MNGGVERASKLIINQFDIVLFFCIHLRTDFQLSRFLLGASENLSAVFGISVVARPSI